VERDPPGTAARKDDSRLRHQGTLTVKERIALHARGTYLNPTATTDCRVRSFSTTARGRHGPAIFNSRVARRDRSLLWRSLEAAHFLTGSDGKGPVVRGVAEGLSPVRD
jgi:hypothetical protein